MEHTPAIDTPETALSTAKDIVGVTALSRELGLTHGAVSQWKRCPAERVLAVERATGGQVTRHQLRPDLYPPADAAGEKAA